MWVGTCMLLCGTCKSIITTGVIILTMLQRRLKAWVTPRMERRHSYSEYTFIPNVALAVIHTQLPCRSIIKDANLFLLIQSKSTTLRKWRHNVSCGSWSFDLWLVLYTFTRFSEEHTASIVRRSVTTWYHNPEDEGRQIQLSENLKFHQKLYFMSHYVLCDAQDSTNS